MSVHAENECNIFEAANVKFPPPSEFEMKEVFSFIGLLRGSNLRNLNSTLYEEIMNLQSCKTLPHYNSELKEIAKGHCARLVRLFLSKGTLDTHTNISDLEKLYGIREVNAISYEFDDDEPSRYGELVYPMASRINNSCSPNCVVLIGPPPHFLLKIMTSVDVLKGETLTICYNRQGNEFGTVERHKVFSHRGFVCSCKRCTDPTEFGSMISAITCMNCRRDRMEENTYQDPYQYGYLLPKDPINLALTSEWECNKCGDVKPLSKLLPIIYNVENLMRGKGNLSFYKQIISDYSGIILHPNHWLIQVAVRNVVKILESNMKDEHLEELFRYYLYLLDIQNKITPGLNEERGELLVKISMLLITFLKQTKGRDSQTDDMLGFCKSVQEDALPYYQNQWPNVTAKSKKFDAAYLQELIRIRESILEKLK